MAGPSVGGPATPPPGLDPAGIGIRRDQHRIMGAIDRRLGALVVAQQAPRQGNLAVGFRPLGGIGNRLGSCARHLQNAFTVRCGGAGDRQDVGNVLGKSVGVQAAQPGA